MKKKISMAHRPFIALLNRNRVLTPALCQSLEAMLPEVERNHMEKLDQHHVRSRYLAGRGVLRLLISFLSMAPVPEKLFHAEDSGPPLGVKCSDGKELSISVSHSGRYSLFGFSKTGRIGVDIEAIRPVRHMNDAAEYAFSPEEAAWLRGVPRNAAASSFIRLWTRKEAVVKFFRGSVAYDMDRFSVPLAAKKGLFTLSADLGDRRCNPNLADLSVGRGFHGAACWEGPPLRLRVCKMSTGTIARLLAN